MGAYSPAPVIDADLHRAIMQTVIQPTLTGMAAEGHRYRGFLYAGLMIAPDGTIKVLEYNCRCGDPETQPIMLRLKSDLIELCEAALDGRLNEIEVHWDKRAALGVVMAAGGYPESYAKGSIIRNLSQAEQAETGAIKVFHAGTKRHDNHIITNGGRVLCVTALGNSVYEARQNAYASAEQIDWDGVFYRKDIGYRAIARESAK
jgi:phosphoribosylamine--glycine ligase